MRLVYFALEIYDTFCKAVFFADVLQSFYSHILDMDMIRHKVSLNKHFVFATFLVFNTL